MKPRRWWTELVLVWLIVATLGAALLLMLPACTEVTRLSPPVPPAPDEILGRYTVSWSGGELVGACVLAGGGLVGFAPYPCATTEEVRGTYEYEDGAFAAEAKSLEGSAKIEMSGRFTSANSFAGEYVVHLLGAPCASGTMTMRRAQ